MTQTPVAAPEPTVKKISAKDLGRLAAAKKLAHMKEAAQSLYRTAVTPGSAHYGGTVPLTPAWQQFKLGRSGDFIGLPTVYAEGRQWVPLHFLAMSLSIRPLMALERHAVATAQPLKSFWVKAEPGSPLPCLPRELLADVLASLPEPTDRVTALLNHREYQATARDLAASQAHVASQPPTPSQMAAKRHGKTFGPAEMARAAALCRQGMHYKLVAAEVGLSVSKTHEFLHGKMKSEAAANHYREHGIPAAARAEGEAAD